MDEFFINETRFDDFYMKHANPFHVELRGVIKLILILSHKNVRVDCGFSVNKDY